MRVLVTGGSGFIGSHAVAELVQCGHEVVALARDPARLEQALAPFGVGDAVDVAAGDMTDPAAVRRAVGGCDAAIHAAAAIGVSGGSAPTSAANVEGVRCVIGEALDGGLDPVLYTSTITAHLPCDDPVVTVDTPLAEPLSAYGASKREAEDLVRGWQDQGAPVTSFTLGGVYGPTSPHLDGSFAAILGALGAVMLGPPGGLGVLDVRDVALLLASALEPGRGPRRYLAGGTFVTWREWTELLSSAAGIEVPFHEMGPDELRELGRHFDRERAAGRRSAPLSEEAAVIMAAGVPTDDTATLADLCVAYRPLAETFSDTVAYLRSIGALGDPDPSQGAAP